MKTEYFLTYLHDLRYNSIIRIMVSNLKAVNNEMTKGYAGTFTIKRTSCSYIYTQQNISRVHLTIGLPPSYI